MTGHRFVDAIWLRARSAAKDRRAEADALADPVVRAKMSAALLQALYASERRVASPLRGEVRCGVCGEHYRLGTAHGCRVYSPAPAAEEEKRG